MISPIQEIIDEIRNGRMVVLVDEEDRENEGDLVLAAQFVTPEHINFMAKHGRGLICLTLTEERCHQLNLPLMVRENASGLGTNFTISIEAATGVTTGISAADRARTIQVAIDPKAGPEDIVTPGHIFPLLARDGGVLVRAGHTEAAVDIARMVGLTPAGVICEIMNDDGTMARLPDLVKFAQFHGLKVGTIADLIAHRRRTETIVEQRLAGTLDSRFGGRFQMYVYVNKVAYAEHIALVRGDISGDEPVLVRMHALSVLDDVLGDTSAGRDGELQASMELIAREGRGVIVLLREPQATSLSAAAMARLEGQSGGGSELRDYGVGAQILSHLGVRNMVLLSNRKKAIIGLEGYGLTVTGHRAIPDGKGAD
jgi:3,4-dihydroxy 2-butanone 4-phosphate synthase/GTP cyclohydrolase II